MWYVIAALVALFLGIMGVIWYQRKREGFNLLGALGSRYKDAYLTCISECEREDPSKFLGKSKGSLNCDKYCSSVLSAMREKGMVPKRFELEERKTAKPPNLVNGNKSGNPFNINLTKNCPKGDKRCVDYRKCFEEVDLFCRQECEHSNSAPDDCMRDCIAVTGANCNTTSWTWK